MVGKGASHMKVFVWWVMWIGWMILISALLLTPADGTAIEDVSRFFGGSELTDALGHVAMMFIATGLLYMVLASYLPAGNAILLSAALSILIGVALELAQIWIPDRGASLVDILAVFVGTGSFVLVRRYGKTLIPAT